MARKIVLGKSLISDAQLRTMYGAAKRLTAAKRSISTQENLSRAERFAVERYPAALLAATFFQLRSGDAVVTQSRNHLAELLLTNEGVPPPQRLSLGFRLHVCDQSASATALVAAGLALHQKVLRKADRESSVTLAILEKEDDLTECLHLAHSQSLPLLLIVRGEYSSLTRARAKRSLVPAIPVDDSDAVAVCRVMQESLIRARHGWSSVVIHALHLDDTSDPVLGLEQHIKRRGLAI